MLDVHQIKAHIQALRADDDTTRREAVRSLKQTTAQEWETHPVEVIQPLVTALQQQLGRRSTVNGRGLPLLRQEASVILGNIGVRSEAAIPQLIELLGQGEVHAVQEAAVTALGLIGSKARPAVDSLLALIGGDCGDPLAARIVRALGDIGCADQRVRAALVNVWVTPGHSAACREQVALALCKLNIDAPLLMLSLTKTLVTGSHLAPRKLAAEALAWCNKSAPGAVPALVGALYDLDEDVIKLAEKGLERMRLSHAKAIQICVDQLEDCLYAETALRKAGAAAVAPLTEAVQDEKPGV